MSTAHKLIALAAVAVAFGALALAAVYSADTGPADPVFSGSPVDGGGDRSADETVPLNIDPVERWFPQAGEGSACSEVVGVDLIPGYSALLTINGIAIDPDDTNVMVDSNGDGIKDTLSAGGSQGEVTWGPEEDCPFGTILRPTQNQVEACIYRTIEGPENCRLIRRPDLFDF